jgi:hypothetical protein
MTIGHQPYEHRLGDGLRSAAVDVDRNGLVVLDRQECLRLLGTATLGRIGITVRALPVILPVNFSLIGEQIICRTGPGTKLDAATRHAIVACTIWPAEAVVRDSWKRSSVTAGFVSSGSMENATCSGNVFA